MSERVAASPRPYEDEGDEGADGEDGDLFAQRMNSRGYVQRHSFLRMVLHAEASRRLLSC